MVSQKDEHIDYSNLPDNHVEEPKRVDQTPAPGDDGHEVDRRVQSGKTFESADAAIDHLSEAMEKDSNVFFEVTDILDALEGWVTRKAVEARSKPARDLLYDLQDWVEQVRESAYR